ncbi:hypothetical protein ES706_00732 [subsurface metagenome]|nr:hypothetical protein [Hadesarchaea archaeon]
MRKIRKEIDETLKTIALSTSRDILKQLAEKPITVRELRRGSKKLRNRVSFYKSLNRMVGLGIVVRYRDPGVRGLMYGLSKSEVVVDLRSGRVEAK